MPLFDRPPIDAISVSNNLFSSGTFRMTGGPNITVGSDASGATMSAGGVPMLSYFDNMGAAASSATAIGSTANVFNTLIIQPLTPANEVFPGMMTANTAMLDFGSFASFTNSNSAASTGAWTSSFGIGIYTMVNSTQLSLLNSVYSTRAQGATNANSTNFSGVGNRWLTIHSSLWSSQPVFSQAHYWFAVLARSAGIAIAGSSLGQHYLHTVQRSGTFGAATVANTSQGWYPFMGVHQTSQTAFPATIGANQINKATASANFIPHMVFNNIASII